MTDRSLADLFEQPMGDWRGKRGARVGTVPAAVRERDYDEGDFAFFKFDPDQPRDRKGRWTDGPLGGVGVLDTPSLSGMDSWAAEASDPGSVTGDDLMRIGARIGEIMQRDGSSMMDPLAMMRATREAVADDGSGITARQYVRAMDRDYGTNLDRGIVDALAAAESATPEQRQAVDTERVKPAPTPQPEKVRKQEWAPDFGASLDQRKASLQAGINSGPADGEQLAGGDVASTHRFTWNDGSRSVLKEAKRTVRGMTPEEQTDAEELAGVVADVMGVRAPAAHRVDDRNVYLEYMPGQSAMSRFGGSAPYRFTVSEEGLNLGLYDQLIGNNDRHTGNWTVDDDDRIYAIDHGLAFGGDVYGNTFGPFGFELLYGGHTIPRSKLQALRERLNGLRGEFDRLGRGEWHDKMMERLDEVESRIGVEG